MATLSTASISSLFAAIPASERSPPSQSTPQGAASLVAIAHGTKGSATPDNHTPAQDGLSGALFDRQHPNFMTEKIRLIERAGLEFGIGQSDYDSSSAYGAAIRRAFEAIKLQPGGIFTLAKIAENLGLGELGVSLDTLINAISEPGGDDSKRLDAGLKAKYEPDRLLAREASPGQLRNMIIFDEIGLYRPA